MYRVLIVDDAPIIRQSVSLAVEQADAPVVAAAAVPNGARALKWLEEHVADLCITDINMPLMDGLELIGNINQSHPSMKSLIISSYDDFLYAKKSIQLHALDYILKPIDEQIFHDSISNAVEALAAHRVHQASAMLVQHLPKHRALVEQWSHALKTLNGLALPLLLMDTLDSIEQCAANQLELMPFLSMLWMRNLQDELELSPDMQPPAAPLFDGWNRPILRRSEARSYYRLLAIHQLEQCGYELLRQLKSEHVPPQEPVIDCIRLYIADRLCDQLQLQELADQVSLNKTYMCTMFKQETGMTIWTYIVKERMKHACSLLLESSQKVYEIAHAVGYEDVNHFNKLFKKHYGLSPLEYKRRIVG
ncbi:response regulator [Paenibacillus sp. J5C_2022]|uniref:response regulator transcription factor n=1 Tax=Paenibacillus sp. J5C2022 TaxID=2977129 RepID=UPI0021D33EF7|nr:response regulator [Paenibacillus sp. J5C2022]MCU6711250.1 response regulator [Paenibacillus sp. J5C2022]